jgi:uncharacterized protein DUF3761
MRRMGLVLIAMFVVGCPEGWVRAEAPAQTAKSPASQTAGDKTAKPAKAEVPRDATGRCQDDTWTTAASKQGACSGHGGVKAWFGPAPKDATARCQDGTWSKAESKQGACSGHGGVSYWINEPKPAK